MATCDEIMAKKIFNFIHNDKRTLFPTRCNMCVRQAQGKRPLELDVDPSASGDIRAALLECAMNVNTKPYIVAVAGLKKLGIDTSLIPREHVIRWLQCDWVYLNRARSIFGPYAALPQLCTGEGCKATSLHGIVKLQTNFPATVDMAGICTACGKGSSAVARQIAAAGRSATRHRTCATCGESKAETSFEGGRVTCTSCRNAQSAERALVRADNAADMRKCGGCPRLVPDTPDGHLTCERCRENGARSDARPQRREAQNARSRANGHKHSKAHRKRQREEDPVGYLESNAKRMRAYNACNCERISEQRRNNPGTRKWSLRKHQEELELRGMHLPIDLAITDDQIIAVLKDGECFYCGATSNYNGGCIGVDRLDSDVNYLWTNCVPACTACNLSKRRITPTIFVKRAICIAGYDITNDPTLWYNYASPSWTAFAKRMLEIGGDLTLQDFEEIIAEACIYCGRDVSTGVDRVDSQKGYFGDNCVSCCGNCNFAKRDENVDDFLARMDAIARRHQLDPLLLESVPMPTRVVTQYGVCDIAREAVESDDGPSTSAQAGTLAPEVMIDPVVCMPDNNLLFWASLQRWGKGKGTTVFVLVDALRAYVCASVLEDFIQKHTGSRRIKTHPTTCATFVNMGSVRKEFPSLPWPKTCTGSCGATKPIQAFQVNCGVCRGCGGTAVHVAAHRARASD